MRTRGLFFTLLAWLLAAVPAAAGRPKMPAQGPPLCLRDDPEVRVLAAGVDPRLGYPTIQVRVAVDLPLASDCSLGKDNFRVSEGFQDFETFPVSASRCDAHPSTVAFVDVMLLVDADQLPVEYVSFDAMKEAMTDAVGSAFQGVPVNDRWGVATFGVGGLEVLVPLTDNKQLVMDTIRDLKLVEVANPSPMTAMDALMALMEVTTFNPHAVPVVVVGNRTTSYSSTYSLEAVGEELLFRGVRLGALSVMYGPVFNFSDSGLNHLALLTRGFLLNALTPEPLPRYIGDIGKTVYELRFETTRPFVVESRELCLSVRLPYGSTIGNGARYNLNQLPPVIETPTPTPSPSPTPSPTPTGTPTPFVTATPSEAFCPGTVQFEFQSSDEGWNAASPPGFSLLAQQHHPGLIALDVPDNSNTFGFTESPLLLICGTSEELQPGQRAIGGASDGTGLFRARYRLRSDLQNTATAPVLRMRSSSGSYQRADVLVTTSVGASAFSPGTAWRTYEHWFPQPAGERALRLNVDVLNVDPLDAEAARLELDRVEVQPFTVGELGAPREEARWDFSLADGGWTPRPVPGLVAPDFQKNADGLQLRGRTLEEGETVLFGYWGSPEQSPAVHLQSGRLYRSTFTVSSTAQTASRVPTFRLRLNTADLTGSAYTNLESVNGEALMPTETTTRQYELFFAAPVDLDRQGLLYSFDYLHVAGDANDPMVALTLEELLVESFAAPF